MSDDGKFAVLMDGTNCLFEIAAADPLLAPHGKRMVWANAISEYAREQGIETLPNPMTLWRAMTDARRSEPRERDGRRLNTKEYLANVNLRALRSLAAQAMLPRELVTSECAKAMHEFHHRLTQLDDYTVYPDMAEFVKWIVARDGLGVELYMVTTQRRSNIESLFAKTNQGLQKHFSDIICSEEISGLEKLSVDFWQKVFVRAGVDPATTVMIGSNGVSDGYAAQAGVRGIFVLDRDGTQEDYFRGIMGHETSRDVPLVAHDQPLPKGRFFTFIREIDGRVRNRLRLVANREV